MIETRRYETLIKTSEHENLKLITMVTIPTRTVQCCLFCSTCSKGYWFPKNWIMT